MFVLHASSASSYKPRAVPTTTCKITAMVAGTQEHDNWKLDQRVALLFAVSYELLYGQCDYCHHYWLQVATTTTTIAITYPVTLPLNMNLHRIVEQQHEKGKIENNIKQLSSNDEYQTDGSSRQVESSSLMRANHLVCSLVRIAQLSYGHRPDIWSSSPRSNDNSQMTITSASL